MRAPLNMGGNLIRGLAPGTDPTDAATVSQIVSGSFPSGAIIDFAGATAPSGWLLCGGQSLSRTEYNSLFAVIGTAFGSVDGGSFSLPDLRGRVTAGRDFNFGGTASRLTSPTITPNGTTMGAVGGTQSHTLTVGQMPGHTHGGTTSSAGAHTHSVASGGALGEPAARLGGLDTPFNSIPTDAAGDHTHSFTTSSAGLGEAHPIVQPTILLNKIIKV